MRQVEDVFADTLGGTALAPPRPQTPCAPRREAIARLATEAGLRRVHLLAWRDLEDAEAGGSEVHASTIARHWADAGVDVTIRTSAAAGLPAVVDRDGYRVVRRAGRYAVFPRAVAAGTLGRGGRPDGLVEVWNGMPFFSPMWARVPRVTFLHHVHAEMWDMALTQPTLARLGRTIEFAIAPPLYRRSRIVTLSASSREEIIARLGLPGTNITVVPPGVDPRFSPGGRRSSTPLIAAVGRLVPVKRFDVLIDILVELRTRHPALQAVIAGEGYEHGALGARIAAAGATEWIHLPGRLSDADLVLLYRRAWVVASTSAREGWGMTLTEAAACATPGVASAIAGHTDAVAHGVSGLLADDPGQLREALDAVIGDPVLRRRLSRGALARSSELTWEATAHGAMGALADEAHRRGARGPNPPPTRPGLRLAPRRAGDL